MREVGLLSPFVSQRYKPEKNSQTSDLLLSKNKRGIPITDDNPVIPAGFNGMHILALQAPQLPRGSMCELIAKRKLNLIIPDFMPPHIDDGVLY